MEFFLNPWYMAAGGALVSSPVIIHLINRMRFKRIRWAAMEFLLKSQKRNRRRLIIEQLILLLLRILMVLLVALLVARWIYGGDQSSSGTAHVVVIDDTLSMRDRWKDDQGEHSAWGVAREQVMTLAKTAALANSAQEMRILLLSDLEHPIFEERLGDKSEEKIGKLLDDKKPTFLHISPLPGLKKGYELLHSAPQGQKILHFVSDFRESDWDSGSDVEPVKKEIGDILADQINVSLIDSAGPSRAQTRDVPIAHDNLAIVDLKPSSRVVAEGVDVTFTATIMNFGKSEQQGVQFDVYVDGKEEFRGKTQFPRIMSQQKLEHKFTLNFQKVKNGPEFARVRAEIKVKAGESPLEADDIRDVVVDVRKRVPILIVDGTGLDGPKDPQFDVGDFKTLNAALAAAKAYEPQRTTVDALEKLELDDFPTIYLVDVPPIGNEAILDKLQKYVEKGGSIVYFLGPKTQATFLNDLQSKRKGLFPVLLEAKPVDTLQELLGEEGRVKELDDWVKRNESKDPTDEDRKRLMRRIWIQGWDPRDTKPDDTKPPRILQGKILFRDPTHPFVAAQNFGLASLPTYYYDNLLIAQYFRPTLSSQWGYPPTEVAEIVTLPQIKSSIDDFKKDAQESTDKAVELTGQVADSDPDFKKYKDAVAAYGRLVKDALRNGSLPALDRALERLLEEAGDEKNPDRPDMPRLWAQPKMKDLYGKIAKLRDRVRFGDPLVLARKYKTGGRDDDRAGYTVAVLTTAGTANSSTSPRWNEWGNGPAQWTYPNFIRPMQSFLSSQGDMLNRVLSLDDKVELSFEKARYHNDVKVTFTPQERTKSEDGTPTPAAKPRDLPTRRLELKNDRLWLTFAEAREPGIYTFEMTPLKGAESDFLSLSYNVDANAEGNLARTATENLKRDDAKDSKKGKLLLIRPGDGFDSFKAREPDVSERPWIYLLALLILIAEQAMAVHLSFHLKGSDAHAPAPAKAAA
jgi:hypothetical protein